MKKLRKLDLSGARILTNPQMKSISGGYGSGGGTCICWCTSNGDTVGCGVYMSSLEDCREHCIRAAQSIGDYPNTVGISCS